jgi:hypothetical protein
MGLIVYPPIFAIWKWNFEVKRNLKSGAALHQPEPEPELTHA